MDLHIGLLFPSFTFKCWVSQSCIWRLDSFLPGFFIFTKSSPTLKHGNICSPFCKAFAFLCCARAYFTFPNNDLCRLTMCFIFVIICLVTCLTHNSSSSMCSNIFKWLSTFNLGVCPMINMNGKNLVLACIPHLYPNNTLGKWTSQHFLEKWTWQ